MIELNGAEKRIRRVVNDCADCDCCRFIMDTSCLFFPELYRLWDAEQETGIPITAPDLRHLAGMCNYCAMCPCPNIREAIIDAKTRFIDRDGLARTLRIMEDVELVGRTCGALPRLSNLILGNQRTAGWIKKVAGIHPARKLPAFPNEDFPRWVRKRGLERVERSGSRRKVAYFAGCTARHLFPEVPKAAVEVLLRNGIGLTYPEQRCCGMPSMLEGDRDLTLRFAGRTIDMMADVVANGYDIVCSCPTCGYMLKQVLCEKAYFSDAYQARVGADDGSIQVPANIAVTGARHDGRTSALKAEGAKNAAGVAGAPFCRFDRAIYGNLLKDDGYFSGIDPLKRIQVAEHTYDLGEYLMGLFLSGEWVAPTGPVPGQMVYYPPCHQREQGIGSPYPDLLAMIPGASIQLFESSLYCCGIAGIMGFKKDFHEISIQMGRRLTERIDQLAPDRLITDCLSCRLQFNQMTAYPVCHPIEILLEADGL